MPEQSSHGSALLLPSDVIKSGHISFSCIEYCLEFKQQWELLHMGMEEEGFMELESINLMKEHLHVFWAKRYPGKKRKKEKKSGLADESVLFIDSFIILCFVFPPLAYGDAHNVGRRIHKQASLSCPVATHL